MADTAVSIDGSERSVDVLSDIADRTDTARATDAAAAPASVVARCGVRFASTIVLSVLTSACDGAAPDAADGGARPSGVETSLLEAVGTLLAQDTGHAPPSAPRWPEDLDFHPDVRAESVELLAALHDADGRPVSFSRRIDRLALRGPGAAVASGENFAFDEVVRLSGTLAARGGGEERRIRRREALERATLGLAGVAPRSLWLRDATLALRAVPGGECALEHVFTEGDGLALRFVERDCPRADRVGALVVSTSPTLAVEGTLGVGDGRRTVAGSGWVRRVWGDVPAPGGAVVFERLLLELDGVGLVDVTRSRRRSGRGPVTTSATVSGVTAEAEWLDGGRTAEGEAEIAPDAWTLHLPTLGVEVVLEALVEVSPERDVSGAVRRGAVGARGSHDGVGFIEVAVMATGSGVRTGASAGEEAGANAGAGGVDADTVADARAGATVGAAAIGAVTVGMAAEEMRP